MSSCENKYQQAVVVIGGSNGIGLSTVSLILNETNFNVIASYNSCDDNLSSLKEKFQTRLEFLKLDLSSSSNIDSFCKTVSNRVEQISAVVLCSGVNTVESSLRTTESQLYENFRLTAFHSYWFCSISLESTC